jgi:two-component system, NarL family, nitrate/nitrite response regulator NarL
MPEKHLRILVVDDQPYVRSAVRSLLESKREWEVCGEASDGREAIAQTEALHPDIVVMDMSMPNLNGLEATRFIHHRFPSSEVVILTLHDFPDLPRIAQEAGAKSCVLKGHSSQFLIPAVQSVSNCTPFFPHDRSGPHGHA